MIGLANPNPSLCDDCGDEGCDGFTETAGGDLLCPGCFESYQERQAEAADEAASEAYYGGDCAPEVYERATQRAVRVAS